MSPTMKPRREYVNVGAPSRTAPRSRPPPPRPTSCPSPPASPASKPERSELAQAKASAQPAASNPADVKPAARDTRPKTPRSKSPATKTATKATKSEPAQLDPSEAARNAAPADRLVARAAPLEGEIRRLVAEEIAAGGGQLRIGAHRRIADALKVSGNVIFAWIQRARVRGEIPKARKMP